jgi:hypothetical protein
MLDRLLQLVVGVFFADNWGAYVELIFVWVVGFRLRLRCVGWGGVIFGSGIGVGGFVGKLVWFRVVCV